MTLATILVIDGNAENRDLIQRRLERRGYTALLASEPSQGLVIALESGPNLIMMNVSLDSEDWFSMIKQMKDHQSLTTIPIIAISTSSSSEDHVRAIECGCVDFVTVPLDFKALGAKMENALSQAS